MLLQTVQNPAVAPLVKMPTLLTELAQSMDLDPEEFLNNPDEAKLYAELMGIQGGMGGQPPQMPGMAADTGVPAPAMPGEESFSGAPPAESGGMPV